MARSEDVATETKEQILAEAHWAYVESLLRTHGEDDDTVAKCRHHYLTAFLHGWKHAKEDQPRRAWHKAPKAATKRPQNQSM